MKRPSPLVILAIAAVAVLAFGIGSALNGSAGPDPGASPTPIAASLAAGALDTAPPSPPGSDAPDATPSAKPTYKHPADPAVGDCFDAIRDDDQALLAAKMVPCAELHEQEVAGI